MRPYIFLVELILKAIALSITGILETLILGKITDQVYFMKLKPVSPGCVL